MADLHPPAAAVKMSETCSCGASFTVDDGEPVQCRKSIRGWREQQHTCPFPRYRSAESTTAGRQDFGFTRIWRRPVDGS